MRKSVKTYHKNGRIRSVTTYLKDTKFIATFDSNGKITCKAFLNYAGVYHNKNGPAYETFVNGSCCYRGYRIYGILHREDGPAVELFRGYRYRHDSTHYYINGRHLSEEEFFSYKNNLECFARRL